MRKYLITGLVILMPVVLTILIIVFLLNFFTTPFVKIVEPFLMQFPIAVPAGLALFISRLLSLVLLIAFIFVLGALVRWFLGKHLIAFADRILYKIPFIRTVYKVSRDVISALFSTDGKKAFKYPVMIPFPHKSIYSLGFQAGEVAKECQEKVETPLVSVFMPTAPHPISGFLFLIPQEDVHQLEMSNEDAFKFLVSCGMIHPEGETAKRDEHHDFP